MFPSSRANLGNQFACVCVGLFTCAHVSRPEVVGSQMPFTFLKYRLLLNSEFTSAPLAAQLSPRSLDSASCVPNCRQAAAVTDIYLEAGDSHSSLHAYGLNPWLPSALILALKTNGSEKGWMGDD